MRWKRSLRGMPWHIVLLVTALVGTGLLFIHSSTRGTSLEGLLWRQLRCVLVAVPVMLILMSLPLRFLARHAFLLYGLMLLSLCLVLVKGVEINHARRWFATPFGFLIQPSELAKVVFILTLARYLEFRPPPRTLRSLLGPLLLTIVPCLLIRAEPDLGTALVFLPVAATMLYAACARRRHFALAVVLAVPAGLLLLPFLESYQLERIRTFADSIPTLTASAMDARREGRREEAQRIEQKVRRLKRDSHYHSHQAQVSIGSGGVTGKGLGQGPQNRLRFLPERHNDFVFAVVGEEAGLVGCSALLAAFLLLAVCILRVASNTRDRFGRLVCVGVAVSLSVQAMANMAMTVGLMPVTGLPLPFISQGGSSMLASLAMVGLALGVAREGRAAEPFLYPAPPPRHRPEAGGADASRRRLRPR